MKVAVGFQNVVNQAELPQVKIIVHLADFALSKFQHKRRIVLNTKTICRNVRDSFVNEKPESILNLVIVQSLVTKDVINGKIMESILPAEFKVSVIV